MTALTVIPDTSEALEEFLSNRANVEAVIKEDGGMTKLARAYAQKFVNRDRDHTQQIKDGVAQEFAALMRANGMDSLTGLTGGKDDLRTLRSKLPIHKYNPSAPGGVLDDTYGNNSMDYLRDIWHGTANRDAANKIKASMSSGVPSDGGFLVPETLRSELLQVSMSESLVRSRARVIPMESSRVPFPTIDTSSNVSNVFGGITAYWTEEGATMVDTSPKFGRVVLDAKTLTAYTEVPDQLMADSIISMQAFIQQVFPQAMSWYEDDSFTNGKGAGEPLGWRYAAAAESVATLGSEQDADTIVWENVIAMYARMLPSSLSRAVWVVTPEAFIQLATMALNVGTGGSAVWLTDAHGAPQLTLLGRPVILDEKVGLLGEVGDINFVDFGYYLIGDRQAMTAASSSEYKFGQNMTAFRFVSRVDGRPWLPASITPKNGGPKLTPFVNLAAR